MLKLSVSRCVLVTLLFFQFSALWAADAAQGKIKAQPCVTCHGIHGISTSPEIPNLAGQKQAYLQNAIKQYRDGVRKHAMMNTFAKPLGDADIANIAAFFSEMK